MRTMLPCRVLKHVFPKWDMARMMHTSLLTFHKHRNHPSIFVWCILYVLGELYNFFEIFLVLNEEASTCTCMFNIYTMSNMSKYIYMFNMLIMFFYMYIMLCCMQNMLIYMFCMFFYMFYMFFAWSNMFDMVFYMFIHGWHVLLHVTACTWYIAWILFFWFQPREYHKLAQVGSDIQTWHVYIANITSTWTWTWQDIYMLLLLWLNTGIIASCASTCWGLIISAVIISAEDV